METSGQRYLIAAGTGTYSHLANLPKVYHDIQIVNEVFSELGYITAFPSGLVDALKPQQVKDRIDAWARAIPQERDIVAAYFTGHGERGADRHYLLCRHSDPSGLTATALATDELVSLLAERSIRRLLLIIDTCLAGRGTADIFRQEAQRLKEAVISSGRLSATSDTLSSLAVIAAVGPRDQAADGAFAEALRMAVHDDSLGGERQKYIYLEELVGSINAELERRKIKQRAELGILRGGSEGLLPNLRYKANLPRQGTDLAEQRTWASEQARQRREELVSHFAPRGLGAETALERGDNFSGRLSVLHHLANWLNDEDNSGRRTMVITGSAGVGKSAVLGRLVLLSDPLERDRIEAVKALNYPPVKRGAVTVAVHARHKTSADILAALADAADVNASTPRELISALQLRTAPFVAVIDGLDEAGTVTGKDAPDRLVNDLLLRELADVKCVRLIVGTRRSHVEALGAAVALIDLDDSRWLDQDDMIAYVAQLLSEPDGPGSRGNISSGDTATVARGVAENAYPNFLIARLIARAFTASPARLTLTNPDWAALLPHTLSGAFRWALDCELGIEARRARRLLLSLALAEGAGLPWGRVWPAVASAITGAPVTGGDIRWLLRNVGRYVVEVLDEGGRSVYRLYHQSLAEDLRDDATGLEQKQITDALIACVPYQNDRGPKRSWAEADPYILRHLSTHAAAASRLSSLMEEADFLVYADPSTLISVLDKFKGRAALLSAIYRTSYSQHRSAVPTVRRQLLLYDASRFGDERLSTGLADNYTPWQCLWATGSQIAPAVLATLPGHNKAVFAATCSELANGTPIAITAADDFTVCSWDLISLQSLGNTLTIAEGVYALDSVRLPGAKPVMVTGEGKDKIVRIRDAVSGEAIGDALAGGIVAFACGNLLDGSPIAVTSDDYGDVWLWDLAKRSRERRLLKLDSNDVAIVCSSVADGTLYAAINEYTFREDYVHVYDLSRGKHLGPPLQDIVAMRGMSCTMLPNGKPMMVIGTEVDGVYTVDLTAKRLRARLLTNGSTACTALALEDGTAIVIAEDDDGRVYAWDLTKRCTIGDPLTADASNMAVVSSTKLPSGMPVAVSGGRDGRVRLWNPAPHEGLGAPTPGHTDRVTGSACVRLDEGTDVAVTTSDEMVRIWDLTSSPPVRRVLGGHLGQVTAVACGKVAPALSVAVTADPTSLVAWDLSASYASNWRRRTDGVLGISASRLRDDTPVVVTASRNSGVRVWELPTLEPLSKPLAGHVGPVGAVACLRLPDGTSVAVTGGADQTVRVWDLDRHQPVGRPLEGHTGAVRCVACLQLPDGTSVAVTGGADQTVRVWDLDRHQPCFEQLALSESLNALAVTPADDLLIGCGWEVAVFRPPWKMERRSQA
jgi:WD40 repeat protein